MNLNDSAEGRWLSPDPLGGDISNPQSLNRYAYALNNPTTLVDPLGLFEEVPPGCTADSSGFSYSCPDDGLFADAGCVGSDTGGCGPSTVFNFYLPPGWTSNLFSSRPANIISWPQLQKLVHANNKSNQCAELIDCIIFRESHVGLSGGNPRLTLANGLGAGFNASITSGPNGTGAKGLMQLESCKHLGPCVVPYDPFNPAQNIQVGSKFLGQKINYWGSVYSGVLHYNGGPHATDYANAVRNCVTKLQSGDAGGAYAAATGR